MPPRKAPTPTGFVLLGVILAAVGVGCVLIVANSRSFLFTRALLAPVAVLTLILVEALWWGRPWVVRAVDTWAATCISVVLGSVLFAAVRGGLGLVPLVLVGSIAVFFGVLPCTTVRWYVRNRAARLRWGP